MSNIPNVQNMLKLDSFNEDEVNSILKTNSKQLSEMVISGDILSFTMDDGSKYFPYFQFTNDKVSPIVKSFIKKVGANTKDTHEMNNIATMMFFEIKFDKCSYLIHELLTKFKDDAFDIITNKYISALH